MQEAKHTPGPWTLGEIRDDYIDIDAKGHGALARVVWLMDEDKLEAVDAGITEFEDEFLAHIVLPNGQNAGAWMRPQIALAYEKKNMPPLLQYDGDAA